MLRALLACLCLGWAGLPLAAQEQITPDQFLDLAVGKTLTFRGYRSGALVGEEEFLRRDLSVWTDPAGRCTYGVIEIRGPQICFLYEDDPDPDNCWLIFRNEEELLVMSDNLEVQQITRVRDVSLNCEAAPLS